MADQDELIAQVYRKIEREKALIHAATNMKKSTDNPLVQQRVDANIRDGQKNILYLEEKMRELQMRRMGQDGAQNNQRRSGGAADAPAPPPKDASGYYAGANQGDGYGYSGGASMPYGAPYADPRPMAPVPKARPNYSKLGTRSYHLLRILGRLSRSELRKTSFFVSL